MVGIGDREKGRLRVRGQIIAEAEGKDYTGIQFVL